MKDKRKRGGDASKKLNSGGPQQRKILNIEAAETAKKQNSGEAAKAKKFRAAGKTARKKAVCGARSP